MTSREVPELPNDDVNWFLRDLSTSSVNTSNSESVSSGKNEEEKRKKTDKINNKEEKGKEEKIDLGSHLTTTISNSNDHIISKTKPSIGTIHEEPVSSSTNFLSRKRTNSLSSQTSSSGLFGKLKGKFHKSPPTSPSLGPSVFKDNFTMNLKKTMSNDERSKVDKFEKIERPTNSIDAMNLDDPKLDEYIKFYKKPDSNSRKSSFSEGCLLNKQECTDSNTSGKFSSFLRRKSSVNSHLPTTSMATQFNRRSSEVNKSESEKFNSTNYYSTNSSTTTVINEVPILPEFRDLKPLKRVAFHSTTFLIDPPQQIPSRTPRKGNVEVLNNGSLRINPLTEDDKIAIEKSQLGQGGGVVVGGTGSLHYLPKNEDKEKENDKNLISNELKDKEVDEKIDSKAKNLGIEKPVFSNRSNYTAPVEKMALDLMYTRCCHLREILPIPAILKQIPKNSMAPIPLLQLKNPFPTMIEIQTFADFIRIAPIICISLDGISLSIDQFRILLSSMSAKTQLEKLSLRNTPINEEGWSLLCWFLSRNKVLSKLDITQCPALSINVLKKRKVEKKKNEEALVRMVCNKENRSDMDWSLFVATIIARDGIEELILTGCCILDLTIFEKLIQRAIAIKTNRLGLAYNNLNVKQIEVLTKHWMFNSYVRGIDLGYNDFSLEEFFNVVINYAHDLGGEFEKKLNNSQMGFISLNSTNIRFCKEFQFINEELFLKLPQLRYLDLSNNNKLFNNKLLDKNLKIESTESYFTSKLPLYCNLVRIHLENNNLTKDQILAIANILPFCQHLRYISLLGNEIDLTVAAALIQSVKNSKKIMTLEADFDKVPSYFKERLGLYTMRNMEYMMYQDGDHADLSDSKDHENLTSQYYEILELKTNNKLDLNSDVVKNFLDQAKQTKIELHDSINELNKLRLQNILNLQGKETLVRLIFIDSSISKAIKSIDETFKDEDLTKHYTLSELKNEAVIEPEDTVAETALESQNLNSPGLISRSSSKTSLNKLNLEEGNVHKLSSIDKNTFFESTEQLSGEEIRKKIASVSLDQLGDIIKFVKALKEKGIEVSTVFKEIHKEKDSEGLDIDFITKKLKNMHTDNIRKPTVTTADNQKGEDGSEGLSTPMNNDPSNLLQTGEMNELYDEVLHNYKIK